MLQPLYAKLYPLPFYTAAHCKTLDTFNRRPEALSMLPHRVISKRVRFPGFLLYADASFENGSVVLAGILFDLNNQPDNGERVIDTVISAPTTPQMIALFRQTSTIFGLELLALAMSLYQLRHKLAYRSLIVFCGQRRSPQVHREGANSGPTRTFLYLGYLDACRDPIDIIMVRAGSFGVEYR